MKKYIACIALAAAATVHADVTLEVSTGRLATHREALSSAEGRLTLKGTLGASDFPLLRELPTAVATLDLKEIRIEATREPRTPAEGYTYHPAGILPDYCFFMCATPEVILPEETKLSEGAFACARTKTVTLPAGTKEIPAHTFYKSGVTNVTGLEATARVGKEAFCGSCIEILDLPNLVSADEYSFAGMPELREITLPRDASLGKGVLMDSPKLVYIGGGIDILPEYFAANSPSAGIGAAAEASSVGRYAFANNTADIIILGPELQEIGAGAFAGLRRLTSIDANPCGSFPPKGDSETFHGLNQGKIKLYVTPGSAGIWKADETWGKFDIIEGEAGTAQTEAASGRISISILDGEVRVASESLLEKVEIYDEAGRLLYESSPGMTTHTIPTDRMTAGGVNVVRARTEKNVKSAKIML